MKLKSFHGQGQIMTSSNILAQIGIDAKNGKGRSADDVAMNAIRHLIESGKISVDDAKVAVQSVQADAAAAADAPSAERASLEKPEAVEKASEKAKRKGEDAARPRAEKYRTRHVALQFSYDGTDYSGFAQNIGKECDNSVERALFAALERTRLLVSPEEGGTPIANEGEGENEGGGPRRPAERDASARTASRYSRCGRTDKGVHAHGQLVALRLKSAFPLSAKTADAPEDGGADKFPGDSLQEGSLPKNSLDALECFAPQKKKKKGRDADEDAPLRLITISEFDYPKILNNVLPPSIRVLGWCPVSSEFSARFSCKQRTYRYFFPRRNLDLGAMARGLRHMMGRHDFRNMCKMNCEQVYNFERVIKSGRVVSPQRIHSVSTDDDGDDEEYPSVREADPGAADSPRDVCHVEIVGQAFLWHQIRCIMSVLFYVGRGLESPSLVRRLLDVEANPAKPSYEMASEAALVLQDCEFGNLELGRTVRNMWEVTKVLEARWETHAVAAERARDALDSMGGGTEVRWTDVERFVEQIAREKRRKEQKRTQKPTTDDGAIQRALEGRAPQSSMISWGDAVNVIRDVLGAYPHPPSGSGQGQKGQTESSVHVPIMERSKGTTYEEKVRSILNAGGDGTNGKSTKRKARYEENVIKKRKTAEEDRAFYDRMLSQGGSSTS